MLRVRIRTVFSNLNASKITDLRLLNLFPTVSNHRIQVCQLHTTALRKGGSSSQFNPQINVLLNVKKSALFWKVLLGAISAGGMYAYLVLNSDQNRKPEKNTTGENRVLADLLPEPDEYVHPYFLVYFFF